MAFLFGLSVLGLSVVAADEENVGLLRVVRVQHARQVAPSARFSMVIDVEYAIRFNVTIKSSLFEGSPGNLGGELWHGDETVLSGGGDKLWSVNLTAPSSERTDWALTVFAYYFEDGKWKYFTDDYRGPGFAEITIKVARLARLEIDLGTSNVAVQVDGSTGKTSNLGTLALMLPVGMVHEITVPLVLPFDNSTRLVFTDWQDGTNDTKRTLILDGDTKIAGSYRTQYLLRVNSIVPDYSHSGWYNAGANVSLRVEGSIPTGGLLGFIGLRYVFRGWSGDLGSSSPSLNLTMDKPKIVNADFVVDYTQMVIPTILVIGILGGILLAIFSKRRKRELVSLQEQVSGEDVAPKVCDGCGEPIEEDWTHCVHCGKELGSSKSIQG